MSEEQGKGKLVTQKTKKDDEVPNDELIKLGWKKEIRNGVPVYTRDDSLPPKKVLPGKFWKV
jgi:hypothetical protein